MSERDYAVRQAREAANKGYASPNTKGISNNAAQAGQKAYEDQKRANAQNK